MSEMLGCAFKELYEEHEKLGSGAQGNVYRCTSKENGQNFAVKIINKNELDPKRMAMLENELHLLNQMNGEAHVLSSKIVRVFHAYDTPLHTYILMEQILGGTLTEWRSKKSYVTESDTQLICRSLFEGLEYCHQRGIAHRDIKLGNLLLAKPNDLTSVKIADFGFAKIVPQNGLTTRCGTPLYLPPEIVLLTELYKSYGTKCDLWSAGVVVFILLVGMPPFSLASGLGDESIHDVYKKIIFGDLYDSSLEDISNDAKTLIKGLLTTYPDCRWSAKDVLECKWMTTDNTLLPTRSLLVRSKAFDETSCCCLLPVVPMYDEAGVPAQSFYSELINNPRVTLSDDLLDRLRNSACRESVRQAINERYARAHKRPESTATSRAVTAKDTSTPVLHLSLSALGLKRISGLLQKSNPFAIVKVLGSDRCSTPAVIKQTNIAFNNLNPTWCTIVFIEGYRRGKPFYFEVEVFDFEANATGKSKQELLSYDSHETCAIVTESLNGRLPFPHKTMGKAMFEVGEILACRELACTEQLSIGGEVCAQLEPCCQDTLKSDFVLLLRAFNVKETRSWILKSYPCLFFEIYRKQELRTGDIWIKVYQSNVVQHSVLPTWNQVHLDVRALCNSDLKRAIKIIVCNHHWSGEHYHVGEFETTVEGLLNAKMSDDEFETGIFHVKKHGKIMCTCEVLYASTQSSALQIYP